MPIYEYRCNDCGHDAEVLQKVSEDPLKLCPNCGHESLVKLISAAGFQLKGTGWYATDFRGSGQGKPKESDKTGDTAAAPEPKSGTGDAPAACGSGACPACQ